MPMIAEEYAPCMWRNGVPVTVIAELTDTDGLELADRAQSENWGPPGPPRRVRGETAQQYADRVLVAGALWAAGASFASITHLARTTRATVLALFYGVPRGEERVPAAGSVGARASRVARDATSGLPPSVDYGGVNAIKAPPTNVGAGVRNAAALARASLPPTSGWMEEAPLVL